MCQLASSRWNCAELLFNQLIDNPTVDIGQAHIATAKSERQLFVIQSHLVQHRGMDVMNRQRILRHAVTKRIGFAIRRATAKTTTRHENGVAVDVMVSTAGLSNLRVVWCATHFASPDYDRLIQ